MACHDHVQAARLVEGRRRPRRARLERLEHHRRGLCLGAALLGALKEASPPTQDATHAQAMRLTQQPLLEVAGAMRVDKRLELPL